MVLVLATNRNPDFIEISTKPGETAQSVADRICRLRAKGEWFGRSGRLARPTDPNSIPPSNGRIRLGGDFGLFAIAGDERGLGIPTSPLSVTALYDPNDDEVTVSWESPRRKYGVIALTVNGEAIAQFSGDTTHASFDAAQLGRDWRGTRRTVGDCDIHIVAMGNDGDCAASEWSSSWGSVNNQSCGALTNSPGSRLCANWQEELDGMPFTCGITPNWQSWCNDANAAKMKYSEGIRQEQVRRQSAPGNRTRPIRDPDNKPYYQIVSTTEGVTGGLKRNFVGLFAGHTYRVYLRVNTFDMGAVGGNWELSLHAAYCDSSGKDLTTGQLMGDQKLPDGTTGETAGRFALLRPGKTTSRNWLVYSTDSDAKPGEGVTDVTLPKDVTKLTVWFRCRGISGKGIGMDWLKLEDVTPGWEEKIQKRLAEKESR
jgi:hypothetical protein